MGLGFKCPLNHFSFAVSIFFAGESCRHAASPLEAAERQRPFSTPLGELAESLMDIPATSPKLQDLMTPTKSSQPPDKD